MSSHAPAAEKKSKPALGLCVLLILALCGLPLLWTIIPGMEKPELPGMALAVAAVAATFIGLYVDDILSADGDGIERYAVEVCLAAAGALVSLAIVEIYKDGEQFTAGRAITESLGYHGKTAEEAAWILSIFSVLLVAIAFTIAAVLRKHKLGGFSVILRMISALALLVGYSLFLLSILYAA